MKFDCIIQKPAVQRDERTREPAKPASTERVTVKVESGDPGGKPGEFQQHVARALANWYDGAEVQWLPPAMKTDGKAVTWVNRVEDAQTELYQSVQDALETFTRQTGMMVAAINWSVANTCDSDGHTNEVNYWQMGSSLATGQS